MRVTGPVHRREPGVAPPSPRRATGPARGRPRASTTDDADTPGLEQTILDKPTCARPECATHSGERHPLRPPGPYAGTWIQAEGEFTDAEGESRRVYYRHRAPSTAPSAPTQIRGCEGSDARCWLRSGWCCLALHLTRVQRSPEFAPSDDGFSLSPPKSAGSASPGYCFGTNEPRPGDGWRPS